jgi:GNAT superfamily N-acetyltransferase
MERWLDVYSALTAESGGGSSAALQERAQALHGAILRGIPLPCAYGAVGGHPPSACGLAVLQQDLVGLFDVVTHPGNRRLGHGTQLVQGLLNWAYERGARRAYLQMVADNHPARGLYAQLGFEPLYRYWYRISE